MAAHCDPPREHGYLIKGLLIEHNEYAVRKGACRLAGTKVCKYCGKLLDSAAAYGYCSVCYDKFSTM
jgi:hypothetical protein